MTTFRGKHSPLIFHVKENVVGATIGQIFNINISSLLINATSNIRFTIANQQDVAEDIAIGKIFYLVNFLLHFNYR